MLWYKHDTDASNDAKIKKLLIKHGATGYAVYFHCLELIAGNISETNITFELEHDAEIIADNLRIKGTDANTSGREVVERIMREIVDLGLFEEKNGHIFCFKLLKRLDLSMTSNKRLRSMITRSKRILKNHDNVMTHHDKIMQEEKRREEISIEEKRRDKKSQNASLADQIQQITPTELQTAILSWVENRKANRSPVTLKALELGLSKLNEMYPDDIQTQIRCVNESILNNWKGFFPLKEQNKKQTHQSIDYDARLAELNAKRGII